jgi:hypothetical protein
MSARFVAGLDLGQAQDFTALAIAERTAAGLDLRHLERLRGEPYPKIVQHVGAVMNRLAANYQRPRVAIAENVFKEQPVAVLGVDATGVGRAVCDLFRAANMPVQLVPITMTNGHQVTGEPRLGLNVPKKDLVTCAQVLFQSRRLRIARELALADVLIQELNNFRVKITTAANEVFEAWRERDHDDLVLALALACWLGEGKAPLGDQFASGDGALWPLAEDIKAASEARRPKTKADEIHDVIKRILEDDNW